MAKPPELFLSHQRSHSPPLFFQFSPFLSPLPFSPISYRTSFPVTIFIPMQTLFEKMWAFNFEWVKTFDTDMREFAKLLDVNSEVMLTRVRYSLNLYLYPLSLLLLTFFAFDPFDFEGVDPLWLSLTFVDLY